MPIDSLRWLVIKLIKRNEILGAGSFVIPGSPVEHINICENTKIASSLKKLEKLLPILNLGQEVSHSYS